MNAPHVIAVRCNFCSKQRPSFRVHQLGHSAQVICDDCLDWHQHAIDFLGGKMPPGCQGCGKTFEALRVLSPAVELDLRMYVLPKDGIYQVLCAGCVQPYVAKRADLFKGTKFGSEVLKIA